MCDVSCRVVVCKHFFLYWKWNGGTSRTSTVLSPYSITLFIATTSANIFQLFTTHTEENEHYFAAFYLVFTITILTHTHTYLQTTYSKRSGIYFMLIFLQKKIVELNCLLLWLFSTYLAAIHFLFFSQSVQQKKSWF